MHHTTPRGIQKSIQEGLVTEQESQAIEARVVKESGVEYDVHATLQEMEAEMLEAAEALEFERAAMLRDQIRELRGAAGLQAPTKKGGARAAPARYDTQRPARSPRRPRKT